MQTILEELNNTSVNIQGSALISVDGLIIASVLPSDLDEDNLGALSAALHVVGLQSIKALTGGALEHVMVKSSEDYVLMMQAGKEALLTVLLKSHAELDHVILNIKQAIEKIVLVA